MRSRSLVIASFLFASTAAAFGQADVAPTATLRAAYLATNPAQATKDPQTGEVRGASLDLARLPGASASRLLSIRSPVRPP